MSTPRIAATANVEMVMVTLATLNVVLELPLPPVPLQRRIATIITRIAMLVLLKPGQMGPLVPASIALA